MWSDREARRKKRKGRKEGGEKNNLFAITVVIAALCTLQPSTILSI